MFLPSCRSKTLSLLSAAEEGPREPIFLLFTFSRLSCRPIWGMVLAQPHWPQANRWPGDVRWQAGVLPAARTVMDKVGSPSPFARPEYLVSLAVTFISSRWYLWRPVRPYVSLPATSVLQGGSGGVPAVRGHHPGPFSPWDERRLCSVYRALPLPENDKFDVAFKQNVASIYVYQRKKKPLPPIACKVKKLSWHICSRRCFAAGLSTGLIGEVCV